MIRRQNQSSPNFGVNSNGHSIDTHFVAYKVEFYGTTYFVWEVLVSKCNLNIEEGDINTY